MELPIPLSILAALPLAGRTGIAIWHWRAVRGSIPTGQKRVDQHRALIAGLAAFSLAGFAVVGVQNDPRFGLPLFDIVVSCLCFLGSLGIQSWKYLWLHDLVADGLRDAATTALILFVVRLAFAVGPGLGWRPWQLGAVAVLASLMWLVDAVLQFVNVSRAIPYLQGARND